VQRTGDAHALERLKGRIFLRMPSGQAFRVRKMDGLASPFGKREVADLVIRRGLAVAVFGGGLRDFYARRSNLMVAINVMRMREKLQGFFSSLTLSVFSHVQGRVTLAEVAVVGGFK